MRDKYETPEDLREKYGPREECADDIYVTIQN